MDCSRYSFLDQNNISWKKRNDEWIGKRSVWTKDNRACWLEETGIQNIDTWWCGKDADYNEIFRRKIRSTNFAGKYFE